MSKEPENIVLIGAGIMSATLGILLRKLLPDACITIFESLDRVAAESSNPWNNAGTGHSAFCELNYTPMVGEGDEGKVDVSKALGIAHSFEVSKQLWAYLVESGMMGYDLPFIKGIPHMSFVEGEDNVAFLSKRFEAMRAHPIFQDMAYSTDPGQICDWVPLIMEGRDQSGPLGVTRMDAGTDVNFGNITQGMISHLEKAGSTEVHLGHSVNGLTRRPEGGWVLEVKEHSSGESREVPADYVFIGAGGGTLKLLERSGIDEAVGYAGFPISGQFLRCTNPDVIDRHQAKVYGKAAVGSPPMSVPHLDTRNIDGERTLFFGPYAGFTTKFLKSGSYLDLPLSIETHNVWPLLSAGIRNVDLTKYLIKQVTNSFEDRFKELLVYYPNAQMEDWEEIVAGQRVQIIHKCDDNGGGVLKFGTEIVCSEDRSISALLGASPGASTSVSIMLDVIEKMFPDRIASAEWQQIIRGMIPSYGESLIEDGDLCLKTRQRTADVLGL